MSDESEHDDLNHALHNAFGTEVADLEIGATPFTAVMDGGGALRNRRRLAAVSGVAALAVLPVAAVAIFAGGTGGTGGTSKLGPVQAGGTNHGKGPTVPTAPAILPMTTTPPADLIPSPIVTLPPQGEGLLSVKPNPNDTYTVVAGGTIGGQHWRLVRDLFVAPLYVAPGPGQGNHLPMSQRGRAGTQECDFTGLQWGDRPPGTLPDFDAGGGCNPAADGDVERITSPMMDASRNVIPTQGVPLSYLTGRVDSSKITSVVVTIGSRSTTRQPIHPVPGEGDGYYVVFLSPLTFQDEESMGVTGYDAAGHVVAHLDMSTRTPVAH
jgi:hypothetical protein